MGKCGVGGGRLDHALTSIADSCACFNTVFFILTAGSTKTSYHIRDELSRFDHKHVSFTLTQYGIMWQCVGVSRLLHMTNICRCRY